MIINNSLYLGLSIYVALLLIGPLINHPTLLFSRPFRLEFFHRIISARITLFSLINRKLNVSSQYKAFEGIILLHYPYIYLSNKPTVGEIEQLRHSTKVTFSALLWTPCQVTCRIELIKFKYNNREVNVYLIRNQVPNDWKVDGQQFIFYLHGGGFVFGGIDSYSGYECYLSHRYHMPVIHIEFGLCPENLLSTVIDDVVTVYLAMLEIDPNIHRRIIGMGDSTGGTLWLRLIQTIVEQQRPVPRALVLISPWVDLDLAIPELYEQINGQHPLFSLNFILNLRRQSYENLGFLSNNINERKKLMKQSNPSQHSFRGFPPLYITVGTRELFFQDAHDLVNKIKKQGGQVKIEIGYGLMHSYSMFHLWSPEAKNSQENIRKWIEQQV